MREGTVPLFISQVASRILGVGGGVVEMTGGRKCLSGEILG